MNLSKIQKLVQEFEAETKERQQNQQWKQIQSELNLQVLK